MAHMLPCYLHISKGVCVNTPPTSKGTRFSHARRISGHKLHVSSSKGCVVQCCRASSTSTSSTAREYLASEFGWKVRRLTREEHEMNEVAQIQAEAFHTPMALFDDLFFQFFKAEVLSGLIYKLRNSPPDRYACLVAEPAVDSSKSESKLVGIVDATVLRDEAVLQHLNGAEEYLYISGIAVSQSFRKQKIGSVLLKACDVLSTLWEFEYLVLRAYEDDVAARRLYSNAGYKVVSIDPQWVTWIGRKRRVVMIKQSNLLSSHF
ncbi:N-acetyltransferase, putative [Ricinus communis]|uniref:N-acetyltransferase, putative n=2 Tax=Ricinus communis TaxID=3988 RepID=B9SZ62_RICCO|nr:N-acetyltransferase, putative [Ricinus communis]